MAWLIDLLKDINKKIIYTHTADHLSKEEKCDERQAKSQASIARYTRDGMSKKIDLFSTISKESPKKTLGFDDLECVSCGWSGTTDDGVIHGGTWSCPECLHPAKQYSDDILHCISPSCSWWDYYSFSMEKEGAEYIACPECGSKTAWGAPCNIQENE